MIFACKLKGGRQKTYKPKRDVMTRLSIIHLTHWGRVTHTCISKLIINVSNNGLAPCRRQAIIWTKAGILSIGPLETNFSETLIDICIFLFNKMHLKLSSGNCPPFWLVLKHHISPGVTIQHNIPSVQYRHPRILNLIPNSSDAVVYMMHYIKQILFGEIQIMKRTVLEIQKCCKTELSLTVWTFQEVLCFLLVVVDKFL